MKTGRNDPCPCGSGKKYKQCCLAAANAPAEPADLTWTRLRRLLEEFPAAMLRFIAETYGPAAMDEAWEEFMLGRDDELHPDSPHMQVFTTWLFHCWAPDPHDTTVADAALHDVPPTQAFLDRKPRVDHLLRQYLESCRASEFSFFEIERCEPGRGFSSHDLFTGQRYEVRERSASKTMQPGDIFFGLLAGIEGMMLMDACGPVAMPPIEKIAILDFRNRLRRGTGQASLNVLHEWDGELRELYLDVTDRLLNPPLPQMQNTDGEPLVLQHLVFDIDSPQGAFDALRHLDFECSEADQLETAQRDAGGALRRVEIAWKKSGNSKNKAWSNTVLGSLEIDGKRMSVNVNSEQRAATIRKIVEQALGPKARYRAAEVQSADKLMAQIRSGKAPGPSPTVAHEELMQAPEVRAKLAEYMAQHYDDWLTQKIPALGGKTPLAMARTAEGREKVEALVRDIERSGQRMSPPMDESIIGRLRERLGLPQP